MQMLSKSLIFEQSDIEKVSAKELDYYLASGWRHFGRHFFRYNLSIHQEEVCRVFPLRINLADYQHRQSFKKIWRKNQDFKVVIQPLVVTAEKLQLFEVHRAKFTENSPQSLYDFISPLANTPIHPYEVSVYDQDRLIACSFLDVGGESTSSIYGMFDLDYHAYSLGIYTMLVEIMYSKEQGKKHYYHGYCYDISSFYDYKKKFPATEWFDWQGNWLRLSTDGHFKHDLSHLK